MNPTASTDSTPRLCLVLVASAPGELGIRGRVWDFDTGELAEPTGVVPSRRGCCAHCGADTGQMLRVLHRDRALAFCDNGQCVLNVNEVVTFEPVRSLREIGFEEEFIGLWRCRCGNHHVIGGPTGNWTLGYCPAPCGRAVLAQPDPTALLEVAS